MEKIISFDHLLLQKINREWTHPLLDYFFATWTDIHKSVPFQILIVVLLGGLLWKRKWLSFSYIIASLCFVAILDHVNASIVKALFNRLRPVDSQLTFELILRGPEHGGLGFPSSHSAVAFCLAILLGLRFKKALIPLLIFASLTAYSRIYCGVHFPSDVIAGGIFGSLAGVVGYLIWNNYDSA